MLITSLAILFHNDALAFPQPTEVVEYHNDERDTASNDFSYDYYGVDYHVNSDGTSVKKENYRILLKTKLAIEQFSQIRLEYSDKMEIFEVLEAYTLSSDGERHNVTPERIYTQESFSSANAPLYADRKVLVIIFPNLEVGSRVVYQIRTTQKTPYFYGHFSLWETFSIFEQFDDAEINLQAPAKLAMNIFTRGVKGQNKPQVRNGQAYWKWRYSRSEPMKTQNWTADSWTFGPTIMASTYLNWGQLAKDYELKSNVAARVTPDIKKLADKITAGIADRRAQAEVIYRWVAQNIRYVAVYLGNGGLEPNSAQSILDNHYGDCKDHVVILEALLAAKGIESSPVLIGVDNGPILTKVPLISRFNHAITYIPEFNQYLDSTNPWARFGQLSAGELDVPVLLTRYAKLARTPHGKEQPAKGGLNVDFIFDKDGNLEGKTERQLNQVEEIDMRGYFSQVNRQNRAYVETSIMSESGIDGNGKLELKSDPLNLKQQFNYSFLFKSADYVDFAVVGGMTIPNPPGGNSFRTLYINTVAMDNETPFYCQAKLYEETYRFQFPDSVPIIAIPKNQKFRNSAGDYQVEWHREGQEIISTHRLQLNAIRGDEALCQPQDYREFRMLFKKIKNGFRGQIVYGELK